MPDKKRIFVADDDEVIVESLGKLLTISGFEVSFTKNPKEVIPKIKTFKPDLILMDLLMPGLGGIELCEILNGDKETEGIPIIVISALAGQSDIRKAYQLGVVGYVTKPYDFSGLLEEINKAISYKKGDFS